MAFKGRDSGVQCLFSSQLDGAINPSAVLPWCTYSLWQAACGLFQQLVKWIKSLVCRLKAEGGLDKAYHHALCRSSQWFGARGCDQQHYLLWCILGWVAAGERGFVWASLNKRSNLNNASSCSLVINFRHSGIILLERRVCWCGREQLAGEVKFMSRWILPRLQLCYFLAEEQICFIWWTC